MSWFKPRERTVHCPIRDCTADIWFRHPTDGLQSETIVVEGFAYADYIHKCIIPENGEDRVANLCREWARDGVIHTDTAIVPWSAVAGVVITEKKSRSVDLIVPAKWTGIP